MAKHIFLIVGVDQDGDDHWNIAQTLADAKTMQSEMAELAFEPPGIYRIDTDTLAVESEDELGPE